MRKPSWFISIIFGSNPDIWATWKHAATNWQYWYAPYCEMVDVPKDRSRVSHEGMKPLTNGVAPIDEAPGYRNIDMRSQVAVPGRVYDANQQGVGGGRPMQVGMATTRTLTWGYLAWGQRETTEIPFPKLGWYWSEGHPNPYFDRHCIVTDVNGDVHEMIQLDPNLPSSNQFANQALGWGRWRNGKLIDGRAVTAVRAPMHPYVWTPWSKNDPHRLSIVVGDYVGGDGNFSSGLKAGSVVALDPNSPSYAAMKALGGECAAIADALVEFGALVIDRNGYSDVAVKEGDANATVIGHELSTPQFHVQQTRHWITSNIMKLKITMGDLLVAPTGSSEYEDVYTTDY